MFIQLSKYTYWLFHTPVAQLSRFSCEELQTKAFFILANDEDIGAFINLNKVTEEEANV